MQIMKNNCVTNYPGDEASLNLDDHMCFTLYSASLAMTKIYKPLLSKFGLTYPQYLVLIVLWKKNEITVNSLGESLFLDSGTLTPLLKRLEKLALITRKREATDGRQVIIALTQLGQSLRNEIAHVPQKVSCTTGYTLPEINALNQKLKILRANLHANLQKAK
jgi:MarR family transcriptional regulator, organic hydroperoxide resistance regulator